MNIQIKLNPKDSHIGILIKDYFQNSLVSLKKKKKKKKKKGSKIIK